MRPSLPARLACVAVGVSSLVGFPAASAQPSWGNPSPTA